ncbi:hypothetical protein R84B8_01382 [Treponema sp. R8-4-B8]
MRKPLILYIILLVFLAMCKKTPAVTVIPENNSTTADEKVEDKVYIKDKIYIDINDDILSFEIKNIRGNFYIDLSEVFPELHIGDLYIYDKYVVMEEFFEHDGRWGYNGFCVYEYNEKLKIMEYMTLGNKLCDFTDKGPYWFKKIYDDLLFIDSGSAPGIRGITIFDLVNKVEILDAAYYESLSFYNNIVHDLVITEWNIEKWDYDDIIKTRFYELMQNTYKPENDNGLSTEFIVKYNYNILTKEMYITSGQYIFVQ